MAVTNYKEILETAKKDLLTGQEALGNCIRQQEEIEKWIAGLRQTVAALSRMLGEEFVEEDAMGLTDAIRQVFIYRLVPMTPTEVRDALEDSGYDIKKYGNVMASVHSVINRLKERGEIIEAGHRADGKPAYRWREIPKLELNGMDDVKTLLDTLRKNTEAFNFQDAIAGLSDAKKDSNK